MAKTSANTKQDNILTIKGVDYKLKFNIRGFMIFEQSTGKPFEIKTISDFYTACYSFILGANMDKIDSLTFDSFLDECSEHPEIVNKFKSLFQQHSEIQDKMNEGKKE